MEHFTEMAIWAANINNNDVTKFYTTSNSIPKTSRVYSFCSPD